MINQLKYRVIVADDEQELREAICEMVNWEKLGFELVGSAGNGLDALELAEKLKPDLIITDIQMPFISGIELARQLHEISPSIRIAFLSGYDYFEYAKVAIRYNVISYMVKPLTAEGLNREIAEIRKRLDQDYLIIQEKSLQRAESDSFLMSLLLDPYPAVQGEKLIEKASGYGIITEEKENCHFKVMVSMAEGAEGDVFEEAEAVLFVQKIISRYFRCYVFPSNGRIVAILTGSSEELALANLMSQELVEMAERATRCRCLAGISRESEEIGQLHTLYQEAMEALSYTSGMRNEEMDTSVCNYSDMHPLNDMEEIPGLLDHMEQAVKSGSADQLEQAMQEVFEAIGAHSRRWTELLSLQIITRLYNTANNGGEGDNALIIPSEFTPQYATTEAMKNSLGDFCRSAFEQMRSRQKNSVSILCEQTLDEIARNYGNENLSLASVSEILHVSPNYLSAVIRKSTGETFTNLLTGKRMEQAHNLLQGTNMKILEIALHCGYSDQHYFSYCFKKYFGESPNSIRRQMRKGGR